MVRLVRPSSELPADVGSTVTWDPRTGDVVEGTLEGGFDAVINLAGAPLAGKRWSKAQKAKIIGSRSGVAARLLHALKDADSLPEVFLQASAIGAYGDRKLDDTPLDESSDWTEDFLSNVAQLWEASSDVADELGVRRIVFRTGIVLNAAAGRCHSTFLHSWSVVEVPLDRESRSVPGFHSMMRSTPSII